VGHLSLTLLTQADNGLRGSFFLNRPGNAQTVVAVAAEVVEVASMLARLMLGDKVGVVEAALGGVIEAASTQSTASVQCGTAVAAQRLGSLAPAQCRVMYCQKLKGSGTLTAVASVVGDTQAAVAAEDVVWVGKCVPEPGHMANVVSMLVGEPGTVDGAVAR
jgi:hypothetical protein